MCCVSLCRSLHCLHGLDLRSRRACPDGKLLLHLGQIPAASCLFLCWKNSILDKTFCFAMKFDLLRVLFRVSLAAYRALNLMTCSLLSSRVTGDLHLIPCGPIIWLHACASPPVYRLVFSIHCFVRNSR